MNYILFGAAGFIGINLAIELSKDSENKITLVDQKEEFFASVKALNLPNTQIVISSLNIETNFDQLLKNQDVVFHLVSTTVPTTSNLRVAEEISFNIMFSVNLLESCVQNKIKKVVFLSSGGTVYGTEDTCPIPETAPTNPITAYGIQKLTIEKLLYLYHSMYGLEYRIIRLSNPYGPYQRPNGILGAVTSFTYKAINNEPINVYGDGSVVRDFIYIDDAIKAIIKITKGNSRYKLFNLGSGHGTSIREVLDTISIALNKKLIIKYNDGRSVDVPKNYLNISRYEAEYGPLNLKSLYDGIICTANFLNEHYEGKTERW